MPRLTSLSVALIAGSALAQGSSFVLSWTFDAAPGAPGSHRARRAPPEARCEVCDEPISLSFDRACPAGVTPSRAHQRAGRRLAKLDGEGEEACETPAAGVTQPQGMHQADFARLEEAIRFESLPQQKWAVLQSALGAGARFTVAQVGQLITLFDTAAQRVGVVEISRTRIIDRKDRARLYAAFDCAAEQARVKSLLGE